PSQDQHRHPKVLDFRLSHPSLDLAPCARVRIEPEGPFSTRQLLGAEQGETLLLLPGEIGARRLKPELALYRVGGVEFGAPSALRLAPPSPHQPPEQGRRSVRSIDDDQRLEQLGPGGRN